MPILTKLTKAAIEALPTRTGSQVLYWAAPATGYPGLGVLCSGVTDTRSWVAQGKLRGKVTRRVTLGPTARMTAAEAWAAARPFFADIDQGVDPKAEKHRPATVREALAQYLKNPRLSEKTRSDYRARIERHLAEWLDKPIAAITPDMAEARFRAIPDEVAARRAAGGSVGGVAVTGAASANMALSVFRTLWRDQKKRGPMPTLEPFALLENQWHSLPTRKRRVADDDLPRFCAAIEALPSRALRDLLTIGLFTGMREGELTGLRWAEVDLPGRMIRIPAARMKARKPFELPMSSVVADVLIARRALGNDGEYVFPGPGRTGHIEAYTFGLRKIAKATGIAVSPHDLRRTFRSVVETSMIPPIASKMLLAHATSSVSEGYVILSPANYAKAAETVCREMMRLCGIAAVAGVERLEARG